MSDIVERLRDDQPGERQAKREARMELGGLLMEAADEIERLRAALRAIVNHPPDTFQIKPVGDHPSIVLGGKKRFAFEDDVMALLAIARAALGEKE